MKIPNYLAVVLVLGACAPSPDPRAGEDDAAESGKADNAAPGQVSVKTISGRFLTAFPDEYVALSHLAYENFEPINVFDVYLSRQPLGRIEVYWTAGDWMDYGVYYIITDLQGGSNPYSTRTVYLIEEFSTPDRDNGAKKPVLSYSVAKVTSYLKSSFLDSQGRVRSAYTPDPAATKKVTDLATW